MIDSGLFRSSSAAFHRARPASPFSHLLVVACAALALGGCSFDMDGIAASGTQVATAHVGTSEPVLGPDGRCTADANISPSTLAQRGGEVQLGMTECEVVALKGQPTDVLLGESGRGQREVQVLYQAASGKTLYLFTDNKLTRIVD